MHVARVSEQCTLFDHAYKSLSAEADSASQDDCFLFFSRWVSTCRHSRFESQVSQIAFRMYLLSLGAHEHRLRIEGEEKDRK